MRILITGICGFVGSAVASTLLKIDPSIDVIGIDNFHRPGSELNRSILRESGIRVIQGDIRMQSDVSQLPGCDWVIDAAANPSVLAGIKGSASPRQLCEHNLASMVNVLEYCREHAAGLVLLSSSRVYSINALCSLKLRKTPSRFELESEELGIRGVSALGINAEFSTDSPVSLYGATKLAGEVMALEYSSAFAFPVWINRCGVMAGPGQFGTPDQGIVSFWVNAHLRKKPLRFTGFGGSGLQVRDALSPNCLARLIHSQINHRRKDGDRMYGVGGGVGNSFSLLELNLECSKMNGYHEVGMDASERPYDIPWLVMDNSKVKEDFGWQPEISLGTILTQIREHALAHPRWLEFSGALHA